MSKFLSSYGDVKFSPASVYQDPVEKLRVSNPQSMMDTDFEYSLQSSKWETVGLTNNTPSVFVAANEPAFTNDLITYIRPAGISTFAAGGNTFQTLATNIPANRGATGLTTLFGGFANANGSDEASISINFPSGYNQAFLGGVYTFGHYNANGWFGFGTTSSSGFAGSPTNPSTPALHIGSVNNGSTDNNLAFLGTEEYVDAFWGPVFRIRYHGNNTYFGSNLATQTQTDLYFVRNQPSVYLVVFRQFVTDGNNEQLAASTGASFADARFQNTTPLSGTAWTFIGPAAGSPLYSFEVRTSVPHGRVVGDPVSIAESSSSFVDGAYLVATVPNVNDFRYFPRVSDPSIQVETNKTGTYSQTGTALTVTVTGHGYAIGDQIFIDATTGALLDGTYEVVESPAPTANQFSVVSSVSQSTSGSVVVFKNYKTPYTAIYTGGFFTNSSMAISTITEVSGTNRARLNFSSPHGLSIDNSFYVVQDSSPLENWVGSFSVDRVVSPLSIEYTTRSGSLFTANTQLSSTAIVYLRSDAVAIHRSGDGGVQINPGSNSPNAQVIRQTRKYFRYQSGKGLQFSTGVLFRPVYDINTVRVDSSSFALGFITLIIETETEHGLSVSPAAGGAQIELKGFSVVNGSNPYNVRTTVLATQSLKSFSCRVPVTSVPQDLSPGGIRQVEVKSWNDATVRTGMFDEQNGMFFEFDGTDISVVKRSSTQQLSGTVSVSSGSSFVFGTKTKFLSSLNSGDYVVVNGISCIVNEVFSDTKISISPRYRATASASNTKMLKTQEFRVKQGSFSIDNLDGSGPSGYLLDPNKMQMVFMDYSWYGAGKIRFGLRAAKGEVLYFHEMPQNNVNTEAYMRSGNLPGRFEIRNTSSRCLLSSVNRISTAFTSSVAADSDIVTITSASHGLQNGETILFDFANTLSDGLYEVTNATTNTLQIRLGASVRTASSPSGVFYRSIASSSPASLASPHILSVDNAEMFPNVGRLSLFNEYMRYSKQSVTSSSYSKSQSNDVTVSIPSPANLASLGLLVGSSVSLDFGGVQPENRNYTVKSLTSNGFVVRVLQSLLPSTGTVNVFSNTRLAITERNIAGYASQINASEGDVIFSVNQNCAPALSHWGVSVIMDGRFDEDKSYLFTAASRANVNFNNTLVERPLISIRLAPSADYGVPRDYGVRSLINRSAIALKMVGIYARSTGYLITVRINASSSSFVSPNNWVSVGNGSLSQLLDHSTIGGAVTGGDTVFSFFAEEGTNKFTLTQQSIDFIRDLGNSILGGGRTYPDGPDILTVYAQPITQVSTLADVRARISWTEAQG